MFLVRGTVRWTDDRPPLDELAELASQVRARHSGNIDYRFSVDAGDPGLILLQEAWEAAENFAAHGATPEVAQIGEVLRRGGSNASITTYQVTDATEIPVDLS